MIVRLDSEECTVFLAAVDAARTTRIVDWAPTPTGVVLFDEAGRSVMLPDALLRTLFAHQQSAPRDVVPDCAVDEPARGDEP